MRDTKNKPKPFQIPEVTPELDKGPWTIFWDMNSGGEQKEPWDKIYIQAPCEQAKVIFYNLFGHNPERVTCTRCGEDYSISENDTLSLASDYHRKPSFGREGKQASLAEYVSDPDVLVVPAKDIKAEDRVGDVPVQGYVWR